MIAFLRRIWPLLSRPRRRRLSLATAGACFLAFLDAVGVLLIFPLMQAITAAGSTAPWQPPSWLPYTIQQVDAEQVAAILGGIVIALFVLKGVLAILFLRWYLRLVLETEGETATELYRSYLDADYTYHLGQNSATIQRTLNESMRRLFQDALASAIPAIGDMMVIVGIGVVLLVIAPVEAIAAALYFLLLAAGYARIARGLRRAGADVLDDTRWAMQEVQQTTAAIKEVRLSGSAEHFVQGYSAVRRRIARRQGSIVLAEQLPRYYLEMGLVIGVAWIGLITFILHDTDESIAILGVFLVSAFRVLPSMNRILVASNKIKASSAALDHVERDLKLPATSARDSGEVDPNSPIVFDQVGFSYGADHPAILRDIDIVLPPGSATAFVGSSGAGKTTLVNLILGLLDVTSGEIRVGTTPLSRVIASFQRSAGYVPQDVILLDDTIRANIAFGIDRHDIDTEALDRALRDAQLLGLVADLPDGVDTSIGQAGALISGGQRQRIGLARALYRDPAVLVLDEATSALDPETEARIVETLAALRGSRTIVVVTHRLRSVSWCDQVVFLQHGVIAGTGTLATLRESIPAFRAFAASDGT